VIDDECNRLEESLDALPRLACMKSPAIQTEVADKLQISIRIVTSAEGRE
jgi:hypothetical protein